MVIQSSKLLMNYIFVFKHLLDGDIKSFLFLENKFMNNILLGINL